jgi:hypothetical protein
MVGFLKTTAAVKQVFCGKFVLVFWAGRVSGPGKSNRVEDIILSQDDGSRAIF